MEKRKIVFMAVMLIITISNYIMIEGNENIRLIQFLAIFVIGAFSALLLNELIALYKDRKR